MSLRAAALVVLMALGCSSSSASAPDAATPPRDAPSAVDTAATDTPAAADTPAAEDTAAPPVDVSPATMAIITARPYARTVPSGYTPATPTPLVVLLHGYGANGAGQDTYFRLSRLAENRGFLVALPDGTLDPSGRRFWNATDACCDFARAGVDDVAYITAILDDMAARYNVDPRRVFLVGHSNGAFMAHRYACEHPERVAAIVSLAGATWNDPMRCHPDRPVSVLQVHGTNDATIAYNGGMVTAGGVFPSAHVSVARWAGYNHCDAMPTMTDMRLDLDTVLPGADTHVERHDHCTAGAAELWTIENGSHIPSFGATWSTAIYDWLSGHAR